MNKYIDHPLYGMRILHYNAPVRTGNDGTFLHESDSNYKQVIPYVLFTYKKSIFSYRRGKHGGEKRLHEKYSIGVGGHIAVEDRTLFSEDNIGYGDAMWREVAEEIITDFPENQVFCQRK